MKSMKKLLLSVLAIATLVMCFALTSCGECEHVWGEWTATGEATCSGTAEKRVCSECEEVETRTNGDAAAHTWGAWSVKTAASCITAGEEGRACTKCSATETRPLAALGHQGDAVCSVCYNALFTLPEIDFSEYENVKVSLKDYTLTLDYSDQAAASGTMTLDICEGYAGLDEDGELVGAFKATVKMAGLNTNLTKTGVVNGFIEDGVVYIGVEGTPMAETDRNENMYVKYDLSSFAESDDFAEIEGALAQVEALLPEIEEWYTETLAPVFANVSVDGKGAADFAVRLVNGLLKKTVANDGSYTLTIDYDAIKDFNTSLGEKKISEMVDVILGEGVYADVKAFITSDEFYALSVADAIDYIETEQGVDLAELVEALDALLAIVYPVPEGAPAPTVSAMLAGYMGVDATEFDLVAFLRDETMAEYSVMMALQMALRVVDDPETEDIDEAAEAVKEMVGALFTQAEAVTVYDLIAGAAMGGGGQAAPLSSEEEIDPIAMMVERVNAMIDQMAEMSGYTLYFDKNGAFVKSVLAITVSSPDLDLTATITIATDKVTCEIAFAGDFDGTAADAEATVEIVPNGGAVVIDAATIAKIKAEVAKAPALDSAEAYFNAIKACFVQSEDVVKIEGNTMKLLRFNGISYDNDLEVYYLNLVAYEFIYNGAPTSVTVTIGCENNIGVRYTTSSYYAKGKAEILNYDSNVSDRDFYVEEYIPANFDQIYNTIPADAKDEESFAIEFAYDTVTEEAVYADNDYLYSSWDDEIYYYGHLYKLDEEKSDLDVECLELAKYVFKCENCDEEYTFYECKEHNGLEAYTLIDADQGMDAGFIRGELCFECGDFVPYEDAAIIYVESELPTAYKSAMLSGSAYATFVITVGAEDVGAYNFYTVAEPDQYCDTMVCVYKWDTNSQTVGNYIANNDDGGQNGHCFASANLEEGTYIVGVKNWGVNVDEYTLVVEKANVQ